MCCAGEYWPMATSYYLIRMLASAWSGQIKADAHGFETLAAILFAWRPLSDPIIIGGP